MSFKRLFFLFIPFAGMILFSIFCSTGSKSPYNVILITLDTMRADHLGYMNSQKAETPNLNRLASRGIAFENAFSPIPITLPAHASLFYSLPPHEMNIYNNGQIFRPSPGTVSLAEIFRKHGYRTAAFVSLGVLKARFGLNRGFQDYFDSPHPGRWYLSAGEVNQRIFSWLKKHSSSSFFLWIHYSDPHDPYAPPSGSHDLKISLNGEYFKGISLRFNEKISLEIPLEPGKNILQFTGLKPFPSPREDFRYSLNDFEIQPEDSLKIKVNRGSLLSRGEARILAVKKNAELEIFNPEALPELHLKAQGGINWFPSELKQGYREEVEYMDQKIGELLKKLSDLRMMEKTVIIAAGDHGEGLGDYLEHRREYYFGHIHYLKSVYTKIPLIAVFPWKKNSGQRIPEPVTLLDVSPTLIKHMGWNAPPFYRGKDMLSSKLRKKDWIFQETYSPEAVSNRFAGIQFPWQLIFNPAESNFELYRLDQNDNPADLYSQWKNSREVSGLTRRVVEKSLGILQNKKDVVLDKKSLEMLKSLGYIK